MSTTTVPPDAMASAGGVPIWTVASDIAAGGVEREGSSIDSKYLKIIAAAGTQVTEFALVDSGCGRPTTAAWGSALRNWACG